MGRFAILLLSATLFTAAAWAQSTTTQTPQTQTTETQTVPTNSSTAQPSPAQQQAVVENLKDINFDFDRHDLSDRDRQTLQQDANWLKANPQATVSIAGDADERGEIVYNLVLSQKRAEVTRDALISMGVPGDRIEFATGWGKLYPVCNQSGESCWAQNRRAHLTPGSMLQTEKVAQELEQLPITACAASDCR